jgi:hypothetical protein
MTDRTPTIDILLRLPPDEAMALAQFVKRLDFETCARFANAAWRYPGNRREAEVMWFGLDKLQRAPRRSRLRAAIANKKADPFSKAGLFPKRKQSSTIDSETCAGSYARP